jgi:diguanylate cyclase (GGDEF)-like protein
MENNAIGRQAGDTMSREAEKAQPEPRPYVQVKILVIEDNPGDARLIQETIKDIKRFSCRVVWAQRLQEGLHLLLGNMFEIILLDLSLPDSQGFSTFTTIHDQIATIPIVILTGLHDEKMALETVQAGAQDYILKEHLNSSMLQRIISYAIERQRLLTNIRTLSLCDELTGLYNRRGFFTLAEQQIKIADRIKKRIFIFFIDLDRMKWINDTLGHSRGDEALIETATVLRETFRQSDIIGRIGGDEFIVLFVETSEIDSSERIRERLLAGVAQHNTRPARPFELSVSIGITTYEPNSGMALDALISRADTLMYEEKQQRHKNRT